MSTLKVISIRVDAAEAEKLRALANLEVRNLSNWIRTTCLRADQTVYLSQEVLDVAKRRAKEEHRPLENFVEMLILRDAGREGK